MSGLGSWLRNLAGVMAMVSIAALGQEIPDAPTPKTPPPQTNPFPPGTAPAPRTTRPADQPETPPQTDTAPKPLQRQTGGIASSRDDLFTLTVNVTFVQVPVTVKDRSGRLVEGLTSDDFTVMEDGVPQKLNYFTSDPFPLSAAVIVDANLPSSTMKKINETLPSLIGAFSEFDEVALYLYGNTVQQVSGFTGANAISTTSIERMKRTGREGGPPVVGGPMHPGTTVNGRAVDPSLPQVYSAPQDNNVLNDAILRAAQDLSRREKAVRRRIIFVISDGREYGSNAHYEDVRKVLLSQNISIYALGVDTAAIPVYDKLNRIRLPRLPHGDILPKYVSDTGGDMFAEFDRQSIDQAYARITEVARNQYTLGYNTRGTLANTYRNIDVRVHRPNLIVVAKEGYYPLPPPRP